MLVAQRTRRPAALRHTMRQPAHRRHDARRKAIVEPVFGQLKEDRGFTALSLRGLVYATGAYVRACLAHNLGKLLSVCPWPVTQPTTVVLAAA